MSRIKLLRTSDGREFGNPFVYGKPNGRVCCSVAKKAWLCDACRDAAEDETATGATLRAARRVKPLPDPYQIKKAKSDATTGDRKNPYGIQDEKRTSFDPWNLEEAKMATAAARDDHGLPDTYGLHSN